MDEKSISITYETLFEILRREKNREELQKLDDTFYIDVIKYLKDKFEFIEKPQKDLFSVTDKEKIMRELRNIQKILKEIYERREKKIISMAINKSRTDTDMIDTANLLKEEIYFFNSLLNTLDVYRAGVINNVLDGRLPVVQECKLEEKTLEKEELKEEAKEQPEAEFKSADDLAQAKKIRFLNFIPQFIGPELEEYGPYSAEDVVDLPLKVADVLIHKGDAEEA